MDISRYPVIAEWKSKNGEAITIRENGDASHVYFYYIELNNFRPKEAILVSATDGMMDSSLRVYTSKHGNLLLTIVPSKRKREELDFDFVFRFEGKTISINVAFIRHEAPKKPVESEKDKKVEGKKKLIA